MNGNLSAMLHPKGKYHSNIYMMLDIALTFEKVRAVEIGSPYNDEN